MSHEAIDRAIDTIRELTETIQDLESSIEAAQVGGEVAAAKELYSELVQVRKELTTFRELWDL